MRVIGTRKRFCEDEGLSPGPGGFLAEGPHHQKKSLDSRAGIGVTGSIWLWFSAVAF